MSNPDIYMNEIIIDDPELMKLDSLEKLKGLYELLGEAAIYMAEQDPETMHFVYVRIGDGE